MHGKVPHVLVFAMRVQHDCAHIKAQNIATADNAVGLSDGGCCLGLYGFSLSCCALTVKVCGRRINSWRAWL